MPVATPGQRRRLFIQTPGCAASRAWTFRTICVPHPRAIRPIPLCAMHFQIKLEEVCTTYVFMDAWTRHTQPLMCTCAQLPGPPPYLPTLWGLVNPLGDNWEWQAGEELQAPPPVFPCALCDLALP